MLKWLTKFLPSYLLWVGNNSQNDKYSFVKDNDDILLHEGYL